MPYLEYILLALIGSTGPMASAPRVRNSGPLVAGIEAIVRPGAVGKQPVRLRIRRGLLTRL